LIFAVGVLGVHIASGERFCIFYREDNVSNNLIFVYKGTLLILIFLQAALQRENENLQRENGMMSTAWHDLTSRIQWNTVMLQRRSEPSKSWINKQRHAINPTGRR
jgi:hypothetical protein